jgi:hypothetical protein
LHSLLLGTLFLTGRHADEKRREENLCAAFEAAGLDFGVMPKLLAIATDSASTTTTTTTRFSGISGGSVPASGRFIRLEADACMRHRLHH